MATLGFNLLKHPFMKIPGTSLTMYFLPDTCLCRDPPTVGFFNVRECSAAEVLQCAAPQRCELDLIL